MINIDRVMQALEVLDELGILDLEFHLYSPSLWDNQWVCGTCGLPLDQDFHMNRGRPHWYLAFGQAAEAELDDALVEWKLDRAMHAVLDSAVAVISCGSKRDRAARELCGEQFDDEPEVSLGPEF